MTTAKERWAAKAARLESWADKADAAAKAILDNQPSYARDPAFLTQPARSNRGVARARARMNNREARAWELQAKAKAHREKAAELRRMATTNAGDAEARRAVYRAALDGVVQVGSFVESIYGIRRVEKVNAKSLRLAGALGPVTIDKSLCKVVPQRCGTCADWKDSECWSGDRLDGDLTRGSAGETLASETCEAWRPRA